MHPLGLLYLLPDRALANSICLCFYNVNRGIIFPRLEASINIFLFSGRINLAMLLHLCSAPGKGGGMDP